MKERLERLNALVERVQREQEVRGDREYMRSMGNMAISAELKLLEAESHCDLDEIAAYGQGIGRLIKQDGSAR